MSATETEAQETPKTAEDEKPSSVSKDGEIAVENKEEIKVGEFAYYGKASMLVSGLCGRF